MLSQHKTHKVRITDIIACPAFRSGVKTARAGEVWSREYDGMSMIDQLRFESGRLWALVAPRDMLFVSRGKATEAAVEIYKQCKQEKIF